MVFNAIKLGPVCRTLFNTSQGKRGSISKCIWLLEDYRHVSMSNEAIASIEVLKTALRQDIGSQILPEGSKGATVYDCTLAYFNALCQFSQDLPFPLRNCPTVQSADTPAPGIKASRANLLTADPF